MSWDSFHNCSAAIGGYQISRRGGLGWKGGRVCLYVKAVEMPGALPRVNDEPAESLWVKSSEQTDISSVAVGVCCPHYSAV